MIMNTEEFWNNRMEEPNIWRVLRLHDKRKSLQRDFAQFLSSWQEEGMRLSDVLNAIANHARSESAKIPAECSRWEAIATLVEAAAIEAETPGRELP